jgi:hypothetical protein
MITLDMNWDRLNGLVERLAELAGNSRKRTFENVEESPDIQLEQGIYLCITVRSF